MASANAAASAVPACGLMITHVFTPQPLLVLRSAQQATFVPLKLRIRSSRDMYVSTVVVCKLLYYRRLGLYLMLLIEAALWVDPNRVQGANGAFQALGRSP